MSTVIKYDILETMQDCISILSREGAGNDYYIAKTLAHMETAYKLIESSQIYFKPIVTENITLH